MERKLKFGLNVFLLLGIIFSVLGGFFTVLGILLGRSVPGEDGRILGIVFPCIGIPFLLVGLSFLGIELANRAQIRALVKSGSYIWGSVTRIDLDYQVTINNRHPYVAVVCCQHGGQSHFFTSRHLPRHFPEDLVGKQVKVYCSAPKFKPYYVDLEPLLQNLVIH